MGVDVMLCTLYQEVEPLVGEKLCRLWVNVPDDLEEGGASGHFSSGSHASSHSVPAYPPRHHHHVPSYPTPFPPYPAYPMAAFMDQHRMPLYPSAGPVPRLGTPLRGGGVWYGPPPLPPMHPRWYAGPLQPPYLPPAPRTNVPPPLPPPPPPSSSDKGSGTD